MDGSTALCGFLTATTRGLSMRTYNQANRRFYVMDVRGYSIGDATGQGNYGVTYAVCDRDNLHKEVAVFEPGDGGRTDSILAKSARELARELNARAKGSTFIPNRITGGTRTSEKQARFCNSCGARVRWGRWLMYAGKRYCWPGEGCNDVL